MKAITIIGILVVALLLVGPTQLHATNSGPQVLQGGVLSIVKLKTNATGLSACTVNTATASGGVVGTTGTLFGNIRIVVNMTWTQSNGTYDVPLIAFFLLVTEKNIVVSNSTNINQDQNPTNTITDVTMFPNIPVILVLSFKPVCLPPGSLARLLYADGSFGFVFNLP